MTIPFLHQSPMAVVRRQHTNRYAGDKLLVNSAVHVTGFRRVRDAAALCAALVAFSAHAGCSSDVDAAADSGDQPDTTVDAAAHSATDASQHPDQVGADGTTDSATTDTQLADATAVQAPGELCMPCLADDDCAAASAVCVSYGELGRFCATACSLSPGAQKGCPKDYACKSVASSAGDVSTRCVRENAEGLSAECACSSLARDNAAKTACSKGALLPGGEHFCAGTRSCGGDGLTACDAPKPVTETCDGIDNDCDGQTDEATCDVSTPCIAWTCNPGKGCEKTFTPGDCEADLNPCTLDACADGGCKNVGKINCTDGNDCTSDACEIGGVCVHGPTAGACDDGNVCTTADACSGGLCQPGSAKNCDDKNPCTTDKCASVVGCIHSEASDQTPCSDSDPCTDGDLCKFGVCKGGAPISCDDGTDCTVDTCSKGDGCTYSPAKTDGKTLCSCKEPDNVGGQGSSYAALSTNGYTKYVAGTLPIILTSPHGGPLKPAQIPDRTYGVTGNDSNSRETTWLIARELALATGRLPHVVINRLARIKLDASREIKEAAQGNAEAEAAYKAFHDAIATARSDVQSRCGKGLYLDMHTNGHAEKWVELGYLLSASKLGSTDSTLDSQANVNASSLRSLATWSGKSLSSLVRGPQSFGALLAAKQIVAVPSPKQLSPAGGGYFSGGYNTQLYGSKKGGFVDGVQVETHFSYMAKDADRQQYAKHVAAAILSWLNVHYGIDPVDKTFVPPSNTTCAKAAKLDFLAGIADAAGTTTWAADEFDNKVSCGSGSWLDGPQLYFELQLVAGQTYEVAVKADFPARPYLIAKTCSPAAIQSACKTGPLKADELVVDATKKATFKPDKSGAWLLVVDSSAPQWHGSFEVAVTEIKTP